MSATWRLAPRRGPMPTREPFRPQHSRGKCRFRPGSAPTLRAGPGSARPVRGPAYCRTRSPPKATTLTCGQLEVGLCRLGNRGFVIAEEVDVVLGAEVFHHGPIREPAPSLKSRPRHIEGARIG